jgi:tRNA 2-thiouridine synthesizing protein B
MIVLRTLHILNKPPEHTRVRLCLSVVGPEDGVLLIENGVLAVAVNEVETLNVNTERCFALQPDLEARGLLSKAGSAQAVSFEDMVGLVASAENVISW